MSIPFSNTTTKAGIMQLIEKNCGLDDGAITGNPILMAQFTGDVNLTLDYLYGKLFEITGWKWQHADTNITTAVGYPQILANLVSGTRAYAITADANSNLLVDIYKFLVADSDGVFHEIPPVNAITGSDHPEFTDGQTYTGVPSCYNRTGKYFTFDNTPDYSVTSGIKILCATEGTYFLVSDTTAKAGFCGLYHEYLALRPSAQFASRKTLANENSLWQQALKMEKDILDYYALRGKDQGNVMTTRKINYI